MNKFISSLVIVAGMVSVPVSAQVSNQFYGGFDSGILQITNLNSLCAPIAGTSNLDVCDDSSTLLRAQFGYQISKNYAIEGAYVTNQVIDLNDDDLKWTNGSLNRDAVTRGRIKLNSFGLNFKGRYELFSKMDLTGKVGLHFFDYDSEFEAYHVINERPLFSEINDPLKERISRYKEDGVDFYGGIGFQYTFMKDVNLQFGFDAYSVGDEYAKAQYLGIAAHF